MNITEEMLYAAAPEAAERWLDTLPERETCAHNFSLTFEASMWPLLEGRRKRWRTLVLLAAVVAALSALLVGVGADRKDDYRIYTDQQDGAVSYVIRPREAPFSQEPHRMKLEGVPENFILWDTNSFEGGFTTRYVQNTDEKQFIKLYQHYAGDTGGTLLGDYQIRNIRIGGEDAVLLSLSGEGQRILMWSSGSNAYVLASNALEKEDMIRLAENLKW